MIYYRADNCAGIRESESVDIRTVNVNDYIAWKKGNMYLRGGLWKRWLKYWSAGMIWRLFSRMKKQENCLHGGN